MLRRPLTVRVALAFAVLVFLSSSSGAQTPAAANTVIGAALKKAASEKKTVLIEFGASWCTWCRSFEAFVKAPDTGPIIAASFVVTNLAVREADDKKALENPGGTDVYERWSGGKGGIPFYVFLDDSGGKIADSNAMLDGSNIGFPAVPEEIKAFMGLIQKTAPRLSQPQRDILEAYLVRVMPPPAPAVPPAHR